MLIIKTLFYFYQKGKKLFGGRGLTKYSFVRNVKNYSFSHLQTDYAEVFGNKLFLNKKGLALSISHYGTYEESEAKIMEEKIKVGNIVVDVGANIGLHTLNMARIVGNTGRVFAFEPDPSNFEILEKNVKINNYQNIILEQKAVGDKNGRTTLYQSDHPGMHRIFPQTKQAKGQVQVELTSLDKYFIDSNLADKINFIKIDVEGLEFSVLKGMKNILKNNKKIKILFEFAPKNTMEAGFTPIELLNYLTSHDFKLYCIDERTKKLLRVSKNEEILKLCSSTNNTISRNLFCEK
jgi:FkbM family methyltransferase